jgi:hypothetical protein
MKRESPIRKALINYEEFLKLKELGFRKIQFQGSSVRLEFNCKACGAVHSTTFHAQMKRNKEYLDLCTRCASSKNTTKRNALRPKGWNETSEHRKRISEGVRRAYQEDPSLIERRSKTRQRNEIESGFKNSSKPSRFVAHGLYCQSVGEKVFVEWKIAEGYRVERVDFSIPYRLDGKMHLYRSDFLISKEGEIKRLVEVKTDYLHNFKNSYRIKNHLSTYKIETVKLKNTAAERYCKKKGWIFEMITMDDSTFNLLYGRELRMRRKIIKHKNEKNCKS